jgi:glycosyltransferase involved in cell wall biosynthesis
LLSLRILGANLKALATRPVRYLGALVVLVRANLGSANYLAGALGFFPKTVAAALAMERSGIAHLHAHFANHPAAMAFVVHRLTGIPYSFTAHGADLQVDQHMLREKIRESTFVVTISEDNRRMMMAHAGAANADKIHVVRCGVDRRVFARPPEASRGGDRLRIACVGTLYEVKGQSYLLEACGLLREAGVPFTCRFIGDGPDREALEAHARSLGLDADVVFLGRRTRAEVAGVLHDTDVQVVPSVPTAEGRREGLPVVCMEGMAAGAVVVASRLSGIPELIEHEVNGLLVPPRNPEALAAALRRIHEEPSLRARLAAQGAERVASDHDLHRNAQRLLGYIRGEPA